MRVAHQITCILFLSVSLVIILPHDLKAQGQISYRQINQFDFPSLRTVKALHFINNTLYVGGNGNDHGYLYVLEVTDPTSISILHSTVINSGHTAGPTEYDELGNHIAIANNQFSTASVNVENPQNPIIEDILTDLGGSIRVVSILDDNYYYLGQRWSPSGKLMTINWAAKDNLKLENVISRGTESLNGLKVYNGNFLIGVWYNHADHQSSVAVYDLSSPDSPQFVGELTFKNSFASNIVIDNNYAYLSLDTKFLILDLSQCPDISVVGSYFHATPLPCAGTDLVKAGQHVIASHRQYIFTFDVSNPFSPYVEDVIDLDSYSGRFLSLSSDDTVLFVSADSTTNDVPTLLVFSVEYGSETSNKNISPATPTKQTHYTNTQGPVGNSCNDATSSPGPFLVNSGNFYHTQSDLSIPCLGPDLEITRYYNTHDLYDGPFGYGWNMNYTTRLVLTEGSDGSQYATVRMGNGVRLKFTRNEDDSFESPPGKNDSLSENADGTYTLNGGCESCTQKPVLSYTFNSDGSLKSISDLNGNTLNIGYNVDGRISAATDANGRSISFTYGSNGRVSEIDDFSGRTWTYGYDEKDNLIVVTYPDSSQIHYAYDTNNNLTSITDAKGNSVSSLAYDPSQRLESFTERGGTYQVDYDPASKLTRKVDPEGNVFQFGFDDNGNIINKVSPQGNSLNLTWDHNINVAGRENLRGIKTAYTYDDRGNVLTVTRDAVSEGLNATTAYTYDARFDKPVSVTDPLGRNTQMTYDDQGNLLSRQRPIGTGQYEYDEAGNLTEVTDPDGYERAMEYDSNGYLTRTYIPGSSPGIETNYTYDQRGNVLSKIDPNGYTTSYVYDQMDRLVSLTDPDGNTTSFTYDQNGNLISKTDPRGVTTNYEYDAYNQLIRKVEAHGTSIERVTQYSYDSRGNLLSVTDPVNNTTTYTYDDRNRIQSVTTPLGQTVQFEYDPSGNLIAKTDTNGNAISYSYDSLNRLIQVTDAEGHVTTYAYDNVGNLTSVTDANNHAATSNTYDDNDRLIQTSDALGHGRDITYTPGGRILSVTDANGNTIDYAYETQTGRLSEIHYPGGRTETYTYDLAGNILSVSDNMTDITVSYTYDERGRVKTETQLGVIITYDYDAGGNRISMTVPDLGIFTYAYDQLNRLTSITNPYGETTEFEYYANDLRKTITYANNATTEYSYDDANRLQSIVHAFQDGTVINSFDYTYDNAANRISVVNQSGETISYTYDDTYKLLEAVYPDQTISFTYDGVGNRLSRTDSMGTTTYNYDEANRLTGYTMANGSVVSFTYDDNGNINTKSVDGQITAFTYDAKDQLRQIEYPDNGLNIFVYDPMGRRVRTEDSQGIRRYLYAGDNVVADIAGTGTPLVYETVYTQGLGLDDLISKRSSGQTDVYLRDGLNSVRIVVSTVDTVTGQYQYYPYGMVKSQTGETGNEFTYTGRRALLDSSMMYYRSRYYDPVTGRFVKKDRYAGNMDKPLSLNRYVYVSNNPVNLMDPEGELALITGSILTAGSLFGLGVGIGDYIYELWRTDEQASFWGAFGTISAGIAGGIVSSIVDRIAHVPPGAGDHIGDETSKSIEEYYDHDPKSTKIGKLIGGTENTIKNIIRNFEEPEKYYLPKTYPDGFDKSFGNKPKESSFCNM